MNKLEKAKEIIRENLNNARYGIYNTRNMAGDTMYALYDDGELRIDICYGYGYFEVFGLSYEEFNQLGEYYRALLKEQK